MAAGPLLLTLRNWSRFPRLQRRAHASNALSYVAPPGTPALSVLIPARNEAANLDCLLESLLSQDYPFAEILVYDDGSTDATPEIVRSWAKRFPQVRLERGTGLPPGWCGKQHACQQAAELARGERLLFLDADVRPNPGAISALVTEFERQRVPYLSGFPREKTETLAEQAILPLIHFVLLAYLPMDGLFWTKLPAFAAGCGQIVMVDKRRYLQAGGHAAIRASRHDGIQLPRQFRKQGLATGICDASELFECRMYAGFEQVWLGLAKNATEGMANPAVILPFTIVLGCGQVLPLPLLVGLIFSGASPQAMAVTLAALGCSLATRFVNAWSFRQSWRGAWLHPLGVALLLAIQWWALLQAWRGVSVAWKGRAPVGSTG